VSNPFIEPAGHFEARISRMMAPAHHELFVAYDMTFEAPLCQGVEVVAPKLSCGSAAGNSLTAMFGGFILSSHDVSPVCCVNVEPTIFPARDIVTGFAGHPKHESSTLACLALGSGMTS
jgi:hypothetical protein